MGLTQSEKAELAINKLSDVAQTWYIQTRDNTPLRDGPIIWKIFKKVVLSRFFIRETR